MIIDLILDRQDGKTYNAREFYNEVMQYGETFGRLAYDIADALDGGTDQDVKRELCKYIDDQGYNPEIKKYINANTWL